MTWPPTFGEIVLCIIIVGMGAFILYGWIRADLAKVRRKQLRGLQQLEAIGSTAAGQFAGTDYFISYKGENAGFARKLAEGLMRLGKSVWLDQYCIPVSRQPDFKPLYESGIDSAVSAILVTSTGYLSSSHCVDELMRICRHHPPGEIIEICLDQTPELPLRKGDRSLVLGGDPSSDGVEKALSYIAGSDVPTESVRNDDPVLFRIVHRGWDLSFDQTGWEEFGFRPTFLQLSGDYVGKPLSGRTRFGSIMLLWSIGREPGAVPTRSEAEGRLEFREYIVRFLNRFDPKVFGLHPFRLPHHPDFWQMAMAYHTDDGIHRRYSIDLPDPNCPGENLELLFVFSCSGSFRGYLSAIPLMDRLVESVKLSIGRE